MLALCPNNILLFLIYTNLILLFLVAGVTFWSGGTRLVDGINWYWLPSGRKVIYTSWLTGQPDSKVEHCIQLQFLKGTGLFWNDLNCGVAQHFICKAPTKKIARCPSVCSNPTITPAVPLVPKLYIGKENVSSSLLKSITIFKIISFVHSNFNGPKIVGKCISFVEVSLF